MPLRLPNLHPAPGTPRRPCAGTRRCARRVLVPEPQHGPQLASTPTAGAGRLSARGQRRDALADILRETAARIRSTCALGNVPEGAQFAQRITRIQPTQRIDVAREET